MAVHRGRTNQNINLVHAEVGLAPLKDWFDVYPEMSVVVPLDPHLTVSEGGNSTYPAPAHVPVMYRLVLKAYFVP